jgi:hypothetical protein
MNQANSKNPIAFNFTFAAKSFRLKMALDARAISLIFMVIKGVIFSLELLNHG